MKYNQKMEKCLAPFSDMQVLVQLSISTSNFSMFYYSWSIKQTLPPIRFFLLIRSSAIPRQIRGWASSTWGDRYRLATDKCIGNGKNKVANRWYSQLFKKRIQLWFQTFICVGKGFVLPSQLIKLTIIRQYIALGGFNLPCRIISI